MISTESEEPLIVDSLYTVMLPVTMFSSRTPVRDGKDLVEWLKPFRIVFGLGPQKKDHSTCRNLKSWNINSF